MKNDQSSQDKQKLCTQEQQIAKLKAQGQKKRAQYKKKIIQYEELNQNDSLSSQHMPEMIENYQTKQTKKLSKDLRKMVENASFYPYNCIGKILVEFQNKEIQTGTACLISPKHILTAYHTFFKAEVTQKKFMLRTKVRFFPQPLFLKQQKQKDKHSIRSINDIRGINAEVKFFDSNYQNSKTKNKYQYDWVVLELTDVKQGDYRTFNYLKCDFDYDFQKEKQSFVLIPGYPRQIDFQRTQSITQNNQEPQRVLKQNLSEKQNSQKKKDTKKGTNEYDQKIKLSQFDISALFQDISKAQKVQQEIFLIYKHATTKGTSGAPLIIKNPQDNSYKIIGIHLCYFKEQTQTDQAKKQILKRGLLLKGIDMWKKIKEQIDLEICKMNKNGKRKNQVIQFSNEKLGQKHSLTCNLLYVTKNPTEGLKKLYKEPNLPLLNTLEVTSLAAQKKINDQICASFAKNADFYPYLMSLAVKFSQLTDISLVQIIKNSSRFQYLLSINLLNNKITGQLKFPKYFETGKCKLHRLKDLYLAQNQISDEGVRELAINGDLMPNLGSIILSENFITDKGLQALISKDSKMNTLFWISMNRNKITDKGMKILAVNDGQISGKLSGISFNENAITDEGLKALVSPETTLTSVDRIYLDFSNFTDDGFKYFIQNGDKLPWLREIYLRDNCISDVGFEEFVSKFRIKFQKLIKLILTGNEIALNGILKLMDNIQDVTQFEQKIQMFDLACNRIDLQQWEKQKKFNQRAEKAEILKQKLLFLL